jgi:hypothetical protein
VGAGPRGPGQAAAAGHVPGLTLAIHLRSPNGLLRRAEPRPVLGRDAEAVITGQGHHHGAAVAPPLDLTDTTCTDPVHDVPAETSERR